MPFENNQRITRRRSSAGPTPPKRPIGNNSDFNGRQNQGPRPTFLTLRDHGKVFVADLPNLSDGQLAHISKEANEVLNSLEKRLSDLENDSGSTNSENDTLIKASTKRDVTLRFIKSIEEEQDHRKNNPALRDAASESLPRTFLEVARHRLPGATFDSLLREALEACAAPRHLLLTRPRATADHRVGVLQRLFERQKYMFLLLVACTHAITIHTPTNR